jgi:hypothetical protein
LDLCLPEMTIFLKSTLVLRSIILRAVAEPDEDRHHCFCDRDRLVGSESSREHDEVMGKHRAVHISFEVIESLPVAA